MHGPKVISHNDSPWQGLRVPGHCHRELLEVQLMTFGWCSSIGPNFKMITIIICELGAIELQRTLVSDFFTFHYHENLLMYGHKWVNTEINKDVC